MVDTVFSDADLDALSPAPQTFTDSDLDALTPVEENAEPKQSAGQAVGVGVVNSFLNSFLNIPNAIASNIPSPLNFIQPALGGGFRSEVVDGELVPGPTLVEDIKGRPLEPGERVIPIPTAETIRARFSPEVASGQTTIAESVAQQQQQAAQSPIATGIGEMIGTGAALFTGRAPFVAKAARAPKAGALKPPSNLQIGGKPTEIKRLADKALKSKAAKTLANRAGRTAEASLEGAVISILNDGDPAETAAFAAGGQVAGSAILGLTKPIKGAFGLPLRLLGTAIGAASIIQLTKAATPGGRDFFIESIESGYDKTLYGLGLGVLAAVAGTGRFGIRKGFPGSSTLLDGATSIKRGAAIKLVNDLTADSRIEPTVTAIMEHPNLFKTKHARRLVTAVSDPKRDTSKTLDDLMKIRSFRTALESAENENAAFQGFAGGG